MKLIESADPYVIAWEDKNGVRHEKPASRPCPFEYLLTRRSPYVRLMYYRLLVATRDPYMAVSIVSSGLFFQGQLIGTDEATIRRFFDALCQASGTIILRPASMDRKVPLSWEWSPEKLHIRCHCGTIMKLDGYVVRFSRPCIGTVSPCVMCVVCKAHFFPLLWRWNGPDVDMLYY